MAGITIQIEGADRLLAALENLPEEKLQAISDEIEASSYECVTLMKQKVSKDEGQLANAITNYKVNETKLAVEWEIAAQKFYAGYREFGTKSKAVIPAGLETVAAEFKGRKGGDYFDFLNAILNWVKRKGIGGPYKGAIEKLSGKKKDALVEAAEAIAWSILKRGSAPKPFFYPSWNQIKPKLVERIKKIITE